MNKKLKVILKCIGIILAVGMKNAGSHKGRKKTITK